MIVISGFPAAFSFLFSACRPSSSVVADSTAALLPERLVRVEMWLGFGGATLICLAATFVPIKIAVQRMKELER